jgi:hypothetical protein
MLPFRFQGLGTGYWLGFTWQGSPTNNVDKALSYLLHAGYLKAGRVEGKGDSYYLSIPNRELLQIYKNILLY